VALKIDGGVMTYLERRHFILGWLKTHATVDCMDSEFVDAFEEHTKAKVFVMLIGANVCVTLRRDLKRMFVDGDLSRYRCGLRERVVGFPSWVWMYRLKDGK
jgi:hypothetical protein